MIRVSSTESFTVLTANRFVLEPGPHDSPVPSSFVIRGKIEPMPAAGQIPDPVRIHIDRIVRTIDWFVSDVQIDPDGAFGIYEPLNGLFVLSVILGTEELDVEPVFFAQGITSTSFVLKIDDKPHPAMLVH